MARETKIGLLVGLAFIILFGIILSEKGTGRNDQLSTPPIAAYKSVVELIPPTAPPSAQLTRTNKEEVADRLTMTEPGLKLTEPAAPAATSNTETPSTTVKPAEATPVQKSHLPPPETAPKMKALLPPAPTKGLTQQIPAANPTATDITGVISAQDIKNSPSELASASPIAETPKADAELKSHTVQQGETLASICRQYYPGQAYEMLKQVMAHNKINRPEKLMCGQVIKLPAAKALATTDKSATKTLKEDEGTDTNSVISKLLEPVDDSSATAVAAISSGKDVKVTIVPEDKTPAEKQAKKETIPTRLATAKNKKDTTGKMYVVQSKDTLMKIARRIYGTEKAWTKIYEMNKKVIADPKALKSGLKLRMPSAPAGELAAGPKVAD